MKNYNNFIVAGRAELCTHMRIYAFFFFFFKRVPGFNFFAYISVRSHYRSIQKFTLNHSRSRFCRCIYVFRYTPFSFRLYWRIYRIFRAWCGRSRTYSLRILWPLWHLSFARRLTNLYKTTHGDTVPTVVRQCTSPRV